MAIFFFVVEFKCIKKIIHMSTCIRKYFYLKLNSTTKNKISTLKKKFSLTKFYVRVPPYTVNILLKKKGNLLKQLYLFIYVTLIVF